jgi:hypothetical protein
LFKKEPSSGFSLKDDFFSQEEKITETQNKSLEAHSLKKRSRMLSLALTQMGPLPRWFPFSFLSAFWDLLKHDIMSLFRDLSAGKLDLYRLNFAILTLIPKEPDASAMKKFRPISLLKLHFKYFYQGSHK